MKLWRSGLQVKPSLRASEWTSDVSEGRRHPQQTHDWSEDTSQVASGGRFHV
uniref:Uncharacterized protein n=1 Tax=Nothobranchius pienaari TaxID=704102 RepID=A0A1A8L8R2_9TELE